jgi:tRNA 2-thiocytidine biosynthesis protein TtcA
VRAFPIIPCDLCGSQDHLQRKQVKQMLRLWEKEYPGRVETIFNSLQRVAPSHLLDRKLFDFFAVAAGGVEVGEGDKAFDAEDFSSVSTVRVRMV